MMVILPRGLRTLTMGLLLVPGPTPVSLTPLLVLLLTFLLRVQCLKKSWQAITTQPENRCNSVYIQVLARMIFYIAIVKISTCQDGAKRFWKRFIGLVRQNASSAHKRGKQVLLISTDNTER